VVPSLVHVEGNLRAIVHPDVELELDGLILLVSRLVLALLLLVRYPTERIRVEISLLASSLMGKGARVRRLLTGQTTKLVP
jgi:hypothetical protein